jgi:hypothetical protein
MKSKKSLLRPPFLITVATLAGALGPGCGGETTGGPVQTDGGNADCPTDVPGPGSTCTTPGQTCAYEYCGFSREFRCVNGQWSTQTAGSCNPPAVLQCPLTEPQAGAECSAFIGHMCSYQNLCCGVVRGTRDYTCDASTQKWIAGDAGAACAPCADGEPYETSEN